MSKAPELKAVDTFVAQLFQAARRTNPRPPTQPHHPNCRCAPIEQELKPITDAEVAYLAGHLPPITSLTHAHNEITLSEVHLKVTKFRVDQFNKRNGVQNG